MNRKERRELERTISAETLEAELARRQNQEARMNWYRQVIAVVAEKIWRRGR